MELVIAKQNRDNLVLLILLQTDAAGIWGWGPPLAFFSNISLWIWEAEDVADTTARRWTLFVSVWGKLGLLDVNQSLGLLCLRLNLSLNVVCHNVCWDDQIPQLHTIYYLLPLLRLFVCSLLNLLISLQLMPELLCLTDGVSLWVVQQAWDRNELRVDLHLGDRAVIPCAGFFTVLYLVCIFCLRCWHTFPLRPIDIFCGDLCCQMLALLFHFFFFILKINKKKHKLSFYVDQWEKPIC